MDDLRQPLRFVILRHEGIDQPHFDMMLETAPGSALATWRTGRWPIDRPTQLTRLGDHRPDYLTYEGPLSGKRGHVRRIAAGQCLLLHANENLWIIRLDQSTLRLECQKNPRWLATPAATPSA